MTIRRTSTLAAAVIGLLALVATACGSDLSVVTEERALDPANTETITSETAAAPGGHQYGSTLEEWAAVEQETGSASTTGSDDAGDAEVSAFPEIEWEDLIPPGSSGADVMARFQDRIDAVEPGSDEAFALFEEMQAEFDPEAVNTELNGQEIRLAGFVAPLTYEDELVTEFLLVPTFGACVHVPPPPPNQTVLVSLDNGNGLTVDESWGAVWVQGTLSIDPATTDLAAASYKISDATSGAYNDL